MNYHSKIDHTMFKLVSKKVAVRLFTVLSMLFIIQTSAWAWGQECYWVNSGNANTDDYSYIYEVGVLVKPSKKNTQKTYTSYEELNVNNPYINSSNTPVVYTFNDGYNTATVKYDGKTIHLYDVKPYNVILTSTAQNGTYADDPSKTIDFTVSWNGVTNDKVSYVVDFYDGDTQIGSVPVTNATSATLTGVNLSSKSSANITATIQPKLNLDGTKNVDSYKGDKKTELNKQSSLTFPSSASSNTLSLTKEVPSTPTPMPDPSSISADGDNTFCGTGTLHLPSGYEALNNTNGQTQEYVDGQWNDNSDIVINDKSSQTSKFTFKAGVMSTTVTWKYKIKTTAGGTSTTSDWKYASYTVYNSRPIVNLEKSNPNVSCSGNSASITVNGSVTGAGQFTIQWMKDGNNDGNSSEIGGSTSPTSISKSFTMTGSGTSTIALKVTSKTTANCSVTASTTITNTKLSDYIAGAGNADQTTCDQVVTLVAPTAPSGFTGKWTKGSVADKNAPVTNATLNSGENNFTWTISQNGNSNCKVSIKYKVTNNGHPITVGSLNDAVFCDNNQASVTINNVTEGNDYWTRTITPTTGVTADGTTLTISKDNVSEGINTYIVTYTPTDANSCATESIEESFTVTKYQEITISATPNGTFCSDNGQVSLSSNADVTKYPVDAVYGWKGGTGVSFVNSANPNTVATIEPGAERTIYWETKISGCPNAIKSNELKFTNQKPTITLPGEKTICGTEAIDIQAAVTGTSENVTWSGIPTGATTSMSGTQNSKLTISSLPKGSYIITATVGNGNCKATATTIVNNNGFTLTPETTTIKECHSSFDLTATLPDGATGHWRTAQGTGVPTPADKPGTTIVGAANGTSQYVWEVTKGSGENICQSSQTFIVTNSIVSVELGKDLVICDSKQPKVTLEPILQGSSAVTWIIGKNVLNGTGTSVTLEVETELAQGQNVVTAMVENAGCTAKDDITIYVVYSKATADKNFVCEGAEDVTLSATDYLVPAGAGTSVGHWEAIGTATIADINDHTTTARIGGTDNNVSFKWVVETTLNGGQTNTCESEATQPIKKLEVNLSANEKCTTVEQNGEVTIEATASGFKDGEFVGVWEKIAGGDATITSPSSASTKVKVEPGTTSFRYTLTPTTVTNAERCTEHVDVNVVYIVADATGPEEIAVCSKKDYVALTAKDPAPGHGTWEVSTGSGEILDPTSHNTQITQLGHSTTAKNAIRWRVEYTTEGGIPCKIDDFIYIENDSVSAIVPADIEICQDANDEATLEAQDLPETTPETTGKWTVDQSGVSIDNASSPTTKVTNLQPGENKFTWTVKRQKGKSSDYCVAYDDIIVYNSKVDQADAGIDLYVCEETFTNGKPDVHLAAKEPNNGVGHWELVTGKGQFVSESNHNANVKVYEKQDVSYNGNKYVVRYTVEDDGHGNVKTGTSVYWMKPIQSLIPSQSVMMVKSYQGPDSWPLKSNTEEYAKIKQDVYNPTVEGYDATAIVSLDAEILAEGPGNTLEGRHSTATGIFVARYQRSSSPTEANGYWYDVVTEITEYYNQDASGNLIPMNNRRTEVRTYTSHYSILQTTYEEQFIDSPAEREGAIAAAGTDYETWNLVQDYVAPVENGAVDARTGVVGLQKGLNTFRWKVTKGVLTKDKCFTEDLVRVYYTPVEVDAGDEQMLCTNGTTLAPNFNESA